MTTLPDREAFNAWRETQTRFLGLVALICVVVQCGLLLSRNVSIASFAVLAYITFSFLALIGRWTIGLFGVVCWMIYLQLRLADHRMGVIPDGEPLSLLDVGIDGLTLLQVMVTLRFLTRARLLEAGRPRRRWLRRAPAAAGDATVLHSSQPFGFDTFAGVLVGLATTGIVWTTCGLLFVDLQLAPEEWARQMARARELVRIASLLWLLVGVVLLARLPIALLQRRYLTVLEARLGLADLVWLDCRWECDRYAKAAAATQEPSTARRDQ